MGITWSITGVAYTDDQIVTSVHYSAVSGEHVLAGEIRLGPPPENPTPYKDLTPEIMLGWVWEVVNKEATEDILQARSSERPADKLPWEIA